MLAGEPNPITASGRTANAVTPMPANQIAATMSSPGIGTLRVKICASVVVGMLEPVSSGCETFHVLHQRAYRRVDADPPRARRGLYRVAEYRQDNGGLPTFIQRP